MRNPRRDERWSGETLLQQEFYMNELHVLHSFGLRQKNRAASMQLCHGHFTDIMAIFRLAQCFVSPLQGKGRRETLGTRLVKSLHNN